MQSMPPVPAGKGRVLPGGMQVKVPGVKNTFHFAACRREYANN
jgi:hypothetical protein